MVPTRYGSSPMVSSTRPQRESRTTSSTGARPWWTPTRAHRRADRGGHLARPARGRRSRPRPAGSGRRWRRQAAKPVRHSSWAMRRDAEPAGRRRSAPASVAQRAARPARGSTGRGAERRGSAGRARAGMTPPARRRRRSCRAGAGRPPRRRRRRRPRRRRAGRPSPPASSSAGQRVGPLGRRQPRIPPAARRRCPPGD